MEVKTHAWRTVRLRTVQHEHQKQYLTALSHTKIVFAGPVVMAGSLHPIPSRTRSLKSPALMVLRLKAWESKSSPGLPKRFL